MASLVHTHLPKLAEAAVVDYEDPAEVVSLDDGVAQLEPFLTVVARAEADFERLPGSGRAVSNDAVAENVPD